MGANQSYEPAISDVTNGLHAADRKERVQDDGSLQKRRKKAKPASPHRPTVTSVTHNSISLSWLPPRHSLHTIIAYTVEVRRPLQAKSWTTLTKNCQGTHYEARHLDSDTEYVFRVRAENIFGTGKPSAPSSPVTTKLFESSSDLSCFISQSHSPISPISPCIERRTSSTSSSGNFPKSVSYDTGLLGASDSVFDTSVDSGGLIKSPSMPVDSPSPNSSYAALNSSTSSLSFNPGGNNFKRRHSFNVHLDGRVSTILNHSDRFYSEHSLNSSTSTIVMNKPHNNASANNIYANNNNDTDSTKNRHRSSSSSCILRHNNHRSSLQPYRKSTIPILLPGTGSNSLNKLRESRVSLKSSNHDISNGSNANYNSSTMVNPNAPSPTSSGVHHGSVLPNYNSYISSTPRHRGSLSSSARRSRECRHSLGSTASDTNTATSSASSSSTSTSNSTKEDFNYNNHSGVKTGQGSRLSLQSVFSDVTMSNISQTSSDDSSPSRPISFSDIGDLTTELGSFLNGSSFIDSLTLKTSTCTTSSGETEEEETTRNALENEDKHSMTSMAKKTTVGCSNDNDNSGFYDNCVNDIGDDIYKLKNNLKNMEITEEKLKFHDLKERMLKTSTGSGEITPSGPENCLIGDTNSGSSNLTQKEYYQSLDNPWERESESVNRMSENIMAAPYSDDFKIALNAKNNYTCYTSDNVNGNNSAGDFQQYHTYSPYHHNNNYHQFHHLNRSANQNWGDDEYEAHDRDDFRTLRSVLQSNNMIVKQARSLPEVVGVVVGEAGETRTLTRGMLTTIEDEEEEEEEAVRITTL